MKIICILNLLVILVFFSAKREPMNRNVRVNVNTTILSTSLKLSQTLTVNFILDSKLWVDSVMVTISCPSKGFKVSKVVLPTESFVSFNAAELSDATTGYISNKVFIFVRSYSKVAANGVKRVFIMHYDLFEPPNTSP